jgi:hypothetical protein
MIKSFFKCQGLKGAKLAMLDYGTWLWGALLVIHCKVKRCRASFRTIQGRPTIQWSIAIATKSAGQTQGSRFAWITRECSRGVRIAIVAEVECMQSKRWLSKVELIEWKLEYSSIFCRPLQECVLSLCCVGNKQCHTCKPCSQRLQRFSGSTWRDMGQDTVHGFKDVGNAHAFGFMLFIFQDTHHYWGHPLRRILWQSLSSLIVNLLYPARSKILRLVAGTSGESRPNMCLVSVGQLHEIENCVLEINIASFSVCLRGWTCCYAMPGSFMWPSGKSSHVFTRRPAVGGTILE